jgi:hypothetical protein
MIRVKTGSSRLRGDLLSERAGQVSLFSRSLDQCIGYSKKYTGSSGGCERLIEALDEAQFFRGFLQDAAQVLTKVSAGQADASFPATHRLEIGADSLGQVALRPSFEVASVSQPFIGDILFVEHDRLPPGQLLLAQAASLF